MFPQGGPGIGLLLLRIAVATMLALNVTHRFDFSSTSYWLMVVLIVLISLALLLGFLTTVVSIIACLAAMANLFLTDHTDVIYILRILTSAALFFLGPGAYSVDARLFGLRVTVVPPRRDKSTVN
jgi:uncharacterized membrane protein YphA (DoxX/SURF4 family)